MTIKELAKLAKVSPSTISRVVNNSGYVKAEVRKRVEKLIEETGYRPNAFAKALLQNKSHTIGVILPKINSTSSGDTVAGIDEYISKKGYSMLLGNTNHSVEQELEFFKLFQEKMVDGIILVATQLTKAHRETIKKSKIPTVILGQESLDSTPCVVFDERVAAREVGEYIIELGRRKVAFIGVGEYDIAVGKKRKEGFLSILDEYGIEFNENYFAIGDFSVDSGYNACKEIFEKSNEKPDAILAVTDKMAIGAMGYLFEQNLNIPEDVVVVGMGGSYLSRYFHPKLTTAKYDYKNLGYEGAKLLYSIVSDKKIRTRKIVMNHELIVRESSDLK